VVYLADVISLISCGSLQPAAHRSTYKQCPRYDAGHSDVPHRFDVVLRQTEPVYERSHTQQDHAVAIWPLRSPGRIEWWQRHPSEWICWTNTTLRHNLEHCKENRIIIDLNLSPCFKGLMFSFGLFPGFWNLNAVVSEQTECSETLAIKLQTLRNNPKENIRQTFIVLYDLGVWCNTCSFDDIRYNRSHHRRRICFLLGAHKNKLTPVLKI
jgi:hypothetical protein